MHQRTTVGLHGESLTDRRSTAAIERRAIHPGGRSILDKVEAKLELDPAQLGPSRDILRRYGNMSSATVMSRAQSGS